jgi:hypothetical protein
VVLVGWAAVVAMRRFGGEDRLGVQVLTAAFVVVLGAFVFGFRVGAWEVVGLLPIGAVLAGRLLAGRVARAGLVVPLAAVLACYGLLLYSDASTPPPASFNQTLATWLEAHHLTYGLARYWHASSITVDSGNRVRVRPITAAGNQLLITHWNSQQGWYNPRRHDARFIIWPANGWGGLRSLRDALGKPARTYYLDGYAIMVWDKNVLNGPFVSGRYVRWDVLAAASG